MATLPSYFIDFLAKIRPTENQRQCLATGHKTLRSRLHAYEELAPILVSDFLQGSYARSTAVRPAGGKRADVDIVVVTSLSDKGDPAEALERFQPFVEHYYKGKYRFQGRSIGVELSYVDLDIVVTSAPSEADQPILKAAAAITDEALEGGSAWQILTSGDDQLLKAAAAAAWRTEPLRIPNREAAQWEDTHPLEQMRKTHEKNASCNGHYVNVVKAIKWWRRTKCQTPAYPKGYPVEHMCYLNCPDAIETVAEGLTYTLEAISGAYAAAVASGQVPHLPDHGVPDHGVFDRVSAEDFKLFHQRISEAAELARTALDLDSTWESAVAWRKLLDRFPEPPTGSGSRRGGFTPRTEPTDPDGGRFA